MVPCKLGHRYLLLLWHPDASPAVLLSLLWLLFLCVCQGLLEIITFRSLLSTTVFMLESKTCYTENYSSNVLCFADKLSIQYLIWDYFFLSLPQTTKEMIARSCATIVTHPFHGMSWMYETFKIIEIASTDSSNIMHWMHPEVSSGMSNTRPTGQKRPTRRFNLALWMTVNCERLKKSIIFTINCLSTLGTGHIGVLELNFPVHLLRYSKVR